MFDYKGKYIRTELKSYSDLFNLPQLFLECFVYRGHADSSWQLHSSLYRMTEEYHGTNGTMLYMGMYENEMIKEFKYKYQTYDSKFTPKDTEIIEWLAIMQHYGAPTRMIDFSYSPFVALYMALTEKTNKDSTLWCLNRYASQFPIGEDVYYGSGKVKFSDDSDKVKFIYDSANEIILKKTKPLPCVYLVKPKYTTERLIKQHGLFAIPGVEYLDLIDNLKPILANISPSLVDIDDLIKESVENEGFNSHNYLLIEITIPVKLKLDIIYFLNKMDINAETLFPGLEGLGKSMKYPRHRFSN